MYDDFKWCRPSEIWKGEIELFSNGIEPNDINQGFLGNCYFLASLSALAEFPTRVSEIFYQE